MQSFNSVNRRLNRLLIQRFSGGGHEVVIPKIDLNQSWIQGSGSFTSLEGFKDLHHHPHHSDVHPYAHLVDKSVVSFERLFFTDAYYHEDDHEDLMNQPHGYLTNDDPLDTRNSFDIPTLEVVFLMKVILVLGFMYGVHGMELRGPGEKLYQDSLTAELLEDGMRKIRLENQALEQRRDELKKQLNK